MPVFALIPLAVIGLTLWWVSRRLVRAPAFPSRLLRYAVPLALVLLTALSFTSLRGGPGFLGETLARWVAWLGATWLVVLLYLVLALVVVAVVSWSTRLFPATDTRNNRIHINRVGAPLAVLVALAGTGFGVYRAADPQITRATLSSDQLPESFSGTKIALVTDLHIGPIRDARFTQEVVDKINAAAPDLVVLGGDMIDGPASRFGAQIAPLSQLKAPLGVVAILGNHEMYSGTTEQWVRDLDAVGVDVLVNQMRLIPKGDASIKLVGFSDVSGEGEFAPDYAKPLTRVSSDDFTIALAHQPRAALRLQGKGIDLQLSGHTHGGQVWPFRPLVRLQQPVIDGLHSVGDVPVLTSRGAGAWGPPVRTGADPEIPIMTLTRR